MTADEQRAIEALNARHDEIIEGEHQRAVELRGRLTVGPLDRIAAGPPSSRHRHRLSVSRKLRRGDSVTSTAVWLDDFQLAGELEHLAQCVRSGDEIEVIIERRTT